MLGGYMGKVLQINLSKKKYEIEELSDTLVKKYIGGSGLAAKLLYDLTNGATDPLGEDNPLIFMTGPFTGTIIPTSARHTVVAKSPLTGIWAESDVGGSWGYELKRAGFDGIIITGKAEKPVYIWIRNGKVEIKDAQHLWGIDTYNLDSVLKAETDPKAVVTCIGKAGENQVLLSSIMADGFHARVAGRCGLGAVMGSKKLKAIVVKGNQKAIVINREKLRKLIKQHAPIIAKETKMFGKYGTSGGIEGHEEMMNFPIKNWYQERWPEGAKKINGIKMAETILTGRYYCKTCIIGCGREVEITKGPYVGVKGAGPEYETIGTLGGLCLIDNLEAIAKGSELCNRYGLDTISTGAAIAFAMEAYEKGIINQKDTEGVKLTWGNAEVMLILIEKITKKEGYIGRLLGQGVRKAAETLGQGAEEFAIHVKGLEFPAHDPRAYNGVALSYATSNRGACHLQGFTHGFEKAFTMPEIGISQPHPRHQIEGKGKFTAKLQDLMCLFDSLKLCKFAIIGGIKLTTMTDCYNAVTGLNLKNEDLMKIGERLYNLKRLYNVRCGISRKDDTLPPRILTHKRGPNFPHLGKMLHDYYNFRNWNERGIPSREKLKELGLDKEAQQIEDQYFI